MMRILPFALVLCATACREAPAPFSLGNPFEGDDSGQLTFNLKNDHAPVWSQASDSVYYDAPTFPGLPPSRGMLLTVPRDGGAARPIMPAVQVGLSESAWLAGLALSPDKRTAAFLELTEVRDTEFESIVCPVPPMTPPRDSLGAHAFLKEAVLRVRPLDGAAASDVARLTIRFAGRTGDDTGNVTVIAHPFHRMFDIDGVPFFRPTWSPDGTRIAYSDGRNVRIWTIGQAESVVVPGTEDGVLPAWSPDGSMIAFSIPFRGAPSTFVCSAFRGGGTLPDALFTTTVFTPHTRQDAELVLVRPDGTDRRSLGVGDGPAWTADSRTVVAHRDNQLFRIPVDGSAAAMIANTQNAFEPMISPDGRLVAFARRIEIGSETHSKGNYDIWVAPF